MTMPTAVPVGGWSITGQREDQQLPPGAQSFVKGQTVTFVTGYGVTGSIFVPYAQYTPQAVSNAVTERVAQLDAISALTHTTGV